MLHKFCFDVMCLLGTRHSEALRICLALEILRELNSLSPLSLEL